MAWRCPQITMIRFCLQFVIFNKLWLEDACVIIKHGYTMSFFVQGKRILSIQVLRTFKYLNTFLYYDAAKPGAPFVRKRSTQCMSKLL